tara:strand:+ start:38 stop:277 length:240 start_codon:yes stop_codon:yes gene_type:complete
MIETFITDNNLVEGIFAIMGFIISAVLLKFDNLLIFESIRWFVVWVCRKYGLTFYQSLKDAQKIKNYKLSLYPLGLTKF